MTKRGNVTQLHSAMGSKPPLMSARRKKRALIICAVFGVVITFLVTQILITNARLKKVNVNVGTANTELNKRNQQYKTLKQRYKLLKNDDFVRDLAHNKYGYSKQGETNYKLKK
ncbi:septum formation initiator family protein [Fructilactobacillus vespulae]|uniref:FtsB family cell division protein n=1 Tax=Fructilactobacillus vespulae TaxID=1249630 RepID=UPI0039B55A63